MGIKPGFKMRVFLPIIIRQFQYFGSGNKRQEVFLKNRNKCPLIYHNEPSVFL